MPVHMRHTMVDRKENGRVELRKAYLCLDKLTAKKDKVTTNWDEVTCQNCRIIGMNLGKVKKMKGDAR